MLDHRREMTLAQQRHYRAKRVGEYAVQLSSAIRDELTVTSSGMRQ
jgi:hypothetical protein